MLFAIYAFCIHLYTFCIASMLPTLIWNRILFTGLLIFRGKKSKISRGFQGQIRGKMDCFRESFAGKKSKFTEKSSEFTLEKSKSAEKSADYA